MKKLLLLYTIVTALMFSLAAHACQVDSDCYEGTCHMQAFGIKSCVSNDERPSNVFLETNTYKKKDTCTASSDCAFGELCVFGVCQ